MPDSTTPPTSAMNVYPKMAELADRHLENVLGEVRVELRTGFEQIDRKFQQVVLRETFDAELRRVEASIAAGDDAVQNEAQKAHSRIDGWATNTKWLFGLVLGIAGTVVFGILNLVIR